ncbi:MAG: pyrroline-5-carboxylate reductase [Oscillospiraceae bacterium]|nr:pyrroline-5-carboxylate reductase [Oscillospiraceae bacterium]
MKYAGFIGTGKMGGALASSVIKKVGGKEVMLADHFVEKAKEIAGGSGAECTDAVTLCKECKFIFIGVKPQVISETFEEIKPTLLSREDRFIIVSMAAGVTTKRISDMAGKEVPVIRIMPNTSVSVGAGMTLYCPNALVTDDEVAEFVSMLSLSGELERLDERLIDAGMAVSGCGPAFIYLVMKSLADGGEKLGLEPDTALKLAKQTVLGAARLTIESGTDPEQLKKDVCSKGGATIEGIYVLEDANVPTAFENAVKAAYDKAKKL